MQWVIIHKFKSSIASNSSRRGMQSLDKSIFLVLKKKNSLDKNFYRPPDCKMSKKTFIVIIFTFVLLIPLK